MDPVDGLARASGSLERLVASVGPDDLSAQTPCAEWDVRAVLEHVVGNAEVFTGVCAAAVENVAAWRGSDDVEKPSGMIPGVSLAKMEGEWHEIGHSMGAFGPPCTAPADAPPIDRLVALTGRQP